MFEYKLIFTLGVPPICKLGARSNIYIVIYQI